jgi:DNA-binding transcriptional regulator YiaG
MKDLRDLNEEEFKQVYEYIKEKTNNFTCLNKSLLDESPQYLLIIRFALGLSQLEFSKLLGTTNKQWVRHFEAGRQGFKYSKMYDNALDLINKLFSENKIVDYERTLLLWQRGKAARNKFFLKPREEKYVIKDLNEMNIEDFKLYFNYLKQETNNFTNFDPNIIYLTPEFITIFRIILDISHRLLARIMNIMPRTVRTNQSRTYKMTPEKCQLYIKIFKDLFKKRNIIGKVDLENSIKNFKRISNYDEFESEIINILDKNNVKVFNCEKVEGQKYYAKLHSIIKFEERELNFDFLIFENNKPIGVIEATKVLGTPKESSKRIRLRYRIGYIDHRFQMIKEYYPNIITITAIKCRKEEKELVKRFLKLETLNTDFYFVNDEIKRITKFLEN